MNTPKTLLHFLLAFTALAAASCTPAKRGGLAGAIPGSGNIKTETRDTGAFESTTVEYPADVIIQQGAQPALQIEADDNLLPEISTQVSSGRLIIKSRETDWNARVNPSKMVKITMTVKDLAEIDFAAPIGTLELANFQAGALKLLLSGGAQVTVKSLQVDLFEGVLSGAGDIRVSGTADELKLTHSGMGNFDLAGLQATKALVELSGVGEVIVRVESELQASISGTGSVQYYGNPHVQEKVTGMGSVKRAG